MDVGQWGCNATAGSDFTLGKWKALVSREGYQMFVSIRTPKPANGISVPLAKTNVWSLCCLLVSQQTAQREMKSIQAKWLCKLGLGCLFSSTECCDENHIEQNKTGREEKSHVTSIFGKEMEVHVWQKPSEFSELLPPPSFTNMLTYLLQLVLH